MAVVDETCKARKIDLQLESGEYFSSDKKKQAKKWQEKEEKQAEKTAESKKKRAEAFVPPEEPRREDPNAHTDDKNDVAAFALSLKVNETFFKSVVTSAYIWEKHSTKFGGKCAPPCKSLNYSSVED